MWDFLGSLVSGGLNFLGGQQNRDTQLQIANQNFAAQADLARHGLGYRVEDAVAHGLSPLVGAGVTPASASPVSVGDVGGGFAAMGADIGRAVKALGTLNDRKDQDEEKARRLELEKGALQNDLLRTEIASKLSRENTASQIGPPAPMPSGGLPRGYLSFISGDRSPSRSASGYALEDDKMKQKDESAPGVRRLPLWGVLPLKTHPGRASAQDLENEYGDFAGDVLAVPNVISDIAHTMGQWSGWKRVVPTHSEHWRRASDRNWRPTIGHPPYP